MMYEKMVERLRTATALPVMNSLCQEAADAIEELVQIAGHYEECAKEYFKDVNYYLERMPKWISVEERLPEDLRDVQITVFWHDAWRTEYGYYDGKFWHMYGHGHTPISDVEVIGWMEKPKPMPLQEPPEEET